MNGSGPGAPHDTERAARKLPVRHTSRIISVLGLLAGFLVFLMVAVLPGTGGHGSQPDAITPAATGLLRPPPETDAGAETTATTPAAGPASSGAPAGPAASPPQRLVYPAAGIDVVVHPLDPSAEDKERQTIVPPATMDGYWLTPYGMPGAGSGNTTYIVGHSWQDREAPFNRLSTGSAPGDRLTLATGTGELAYRVESVTTHVKSGLKDSNVWEVAPNKLVLISCYTGDLWGTNVVVVASPEY